MTLLLLIPIALLALFLWEERKRTADLTEKLLSERAASEASRHAERAEWAQERRQLLNRIQRPDVAVYEDFEPSLEKPYVGFDDDSAYWDSQLTEDSNGSS